MKTGDAIIHLLNIELSYDLSNEDKEALHMAMNALTPKELNPMTQKQLNEINDKDEFISKKNLLQEFANEIYKFDSVDGEFQRGVDWALRMIIKHPTSDCPNCGVSTRKEKTDE